MVYRLKNARLVRSSRRWRGDGARAAVCASGLVGERTVPADPRGQVQFRSRHSAWVDRPRLDRGADDALHHPRPWRRISGSAADRAGSTQRLWAARGWRRQLPTAAGQALQASGPQKLHLGPIHWLHTCGVRARFYCTVRPDPVLSSG